MNKQFDLKKLMAVKAPDELIETSKGLMRVGDLERKVTETENDNELTYAIEYLLNGEMIHRSVHVQLKQGLDMAGELAEF